MNKKYIPVILSIAAIIIATFFWEKITLTYDVQNQIHGEYAINHYNANNDVLRFLFFISFPLIVFLLSYLILNSEKTVSLKQVILNKGEKTAQQKTDLNYDFIFIIFIIFLFAEFLSIDFNKFATNLDFFHEGTFLTSSSNSYFTKGLWSSSYVQSGLFGSFGPLFLWKLFGVKTIGLIRLSELCLLLLNKIFLVYFSKKISKNLLFNERIKISYFIILSILLISLISYEDNIQASEFPTRLFLFLLFFIIFFNSLYQLNKFSFLFFSLGIFSTISMLWYIDIGAYINVLLLIILTYFFIRNELKKCTCILSGIVFGWLTFVFIIPDYELKEFFNNTFLIYSTYDYIIGMIYPTPFLSGDVRSTRALLLIILAGILVIIVNFDKNIKLTYYNKTLFIFLFIAALLVFKTGLMRSDTPHIKASSGFTLFLIYSLGLYFLFSFILNQNRKNTIILKISKFFEKNYAKLFLIFIFVFFVTFKNGAINFKNIFSSMNEITKLTNYKDEKYLSSDYNELVKYYKDLVREDKCVQILTNETALPYFLKKPTCTQFYLMWNSAPNQTKFVKQLKDSKPQIILYSSEIDSYSDIFERTPIVVKYVNQNYSFHSKFKFWTFVKIN